MLTQLHLTSPIPPIPDHAELLLSASTQDLEGEGRSWGTNFH